MGSVQMCGDATCDNYACSTAALDAWLEQQKADARRYARSLLGLPDEALALGAVERLTAERDAALAASSLEFERGVRQAVEWLRADYPYGTGPSWREDGAEWIEDRLCDWRLSSVPVQEGHKVLDRDYDAVQDGEV